MLRLNSYVEVRAIAAGTGCASLPAAALFAQSAPQPVRSVTDPGVITTRQTITPAGVQSVFDGRVYGITFGTTDAEVWVLSGARGGGLMLFSLDWRDNRVSNRWPLQGTAALQGLVFDAASQAGRSHRSTARLMATV